MPARSERAARAMAHLAERDPALAALALWCDLQDTQGETRTQGQRILIGPGFTALPLREQIGLLGHHVLHVALRHAARMGAMRQRLGPSFAADTYNLAADALVNEVLAHADHALPRPAVTLRGVLTEVLQRDADDALARWDVERLFAALDALEGTGQERQAAYQRRTGFAPDLADDTPSQGAAPAEEWQGHLTRALQTPGAAGRGVGPLLAKVLDLPRRDTPWERHLRRLLARAVADIPRLSHRRPRAGWIAADAEARFRGGPAPVFEPGRTRAARRARIVVGLDSSGSVSDAVLRLFAGEVAGIARRSGAELHLLRFDTAVYDHAVLRHGTAEDALVRGPFRRGGGTSFVDVIDTAEVLGPSIAVVLTDLDGPFGPPPPFGVIWATPAATWSPPPFGTVLSLAR